MSSSTDEIPFPSPRNPTSTRTRVSGRSRALTQSSRLSDNESTKSSRYLHIARPLPVWVVDPKDRSGSRAPESVYSRDHFSAYGIQEEGSRPSSPVTDKSRWNSFKVATARPELRATEGYIDEKALSQQGDYDSEWLGDRRSGEMASCSSSRRGLFGRGRHGTSGEEPSSLSTARYFVSEESRKVWQPRLTFILLNNPYVPLTLRAIIFILSIAALGLACSIFVHSLHAFPTPITQQPSTIMALVVQSTALIYLVYITYDEYSGKPLGLREPKAKMRLIMLDMLFIIFSSANLSLTFNTLYDVTWTCHVNRHDSLMPDVEYNYAICSRQRGLAAFLFMVLVMWVATFTISIFRLVERVSQ
ncbi:regulator of phospholipase D Srf1p [Trichomonascus vanleenenianus]|uniref:phospholipase D regulator n=1 Tax=Trichomonascus vanleenenianus TaxID=2268995 RepID=UPI003ECB2D0D